MSKIDPHELPRGDVAPVAYSVDAAAVAASISRAEIYRAVQRGELAMKKRGKRSLILATELLRFVEALPASSPTKAA